MPDLTCRDWFDKLKAGALPISDNIAINTDEADWAETTFTNLVLPDVPGMPTMSAVGGQWIHDIVRLVFGTRKDDAGTRDIREFFIEVPKKNAKTTSGAGIMVTALLQNRRPRAEFLLVGPTQEIADIAFRQAAGMIENDPAGLLQKRFQIRDHVKTITDINPDGPGFKSKLRIKTFDTRVVTGGGHAGCLIDELHVMGQMKDASKVMKQIRGGMYACPEAFLVIITTQSDEPPTGLFKRELDYARAIRDGEQAEGEEEDGVERDQDGDLVPILYEFPRTIQADEKRPWRNPEMWPLVLPNLDRSVSLERLKSECIKAERKGVEEFSEWASQHLNIEIGIALSKDRWRGVEYWQRNAEPTITLESLIERSEVIVVGVDGGGLDDMFALTALGRETNKKKSGVGEDDNHQRYMAWSRAWIQTEALTARPQNEQKYRQFEQEGDLVVCTYPSQDAMEAAGICMQIEAAGKFPEKHAIGVDANGITDFIDEAINGGIDNEKISGVPQGYRLHGAILGAERQLKSGRLIHDGSEMMKWCVGNGKVTMRGSAVYLEKQIAGRAKIDPLISLFNAYSLMSRHPVAASTRSVYRDRGALLL